MKTISFRVARRYVKALASKKLPALVDVTLHAVERGDYDDAHRKYDQFLKAIGVFGGRIVSEWAHNLTEQQISEYNRWLQEILSIRDRLRDAARPQPGEQPRLGDIEWDLGIIKHNFVEWVEPFFRDEDDEFAHGPFKVLLSDDARDGLDEALKTLDLAAAKIKPKFPKVLYGKVFITRGLKGGTYAVAPSRAGSYVAARDSINLSLYATADRDSVMTLIHEFGHRYHTRFLHGDQREKFIQLSTEGDYEVHHFPMSERRKLVDEYVNLLLKHRIGEYPTDALSDRAEVWFRNYPRDEWKEKVVPHIRAFRDDQDDSVETDLREGLGMYWLDGNVRVETNNDPRRPRQPLAASAYGATSWEENFAECFLHFCIGRELPEPLQKFMAAL